VSDLFLFEQNKLNMNRNMSSLIGGVGSTYSTRRIVCYSVPGQATHTEDTCHGAGNRVGGGHNPPSSLRRPARACHAAGLLLLLLCNEHQLASSSVF